MITPLFEVECGRIFSFLLIAVIREGSKTKKFTNVVKDYAMQFNTQSAYLTSISEENFKSCSQVQLLKPFSSGTLLQQITFHILSL